MDCRQDQLHDLWGSGGKENVVSCSDTITNVMANDSEALSPAWTLLSMGACATAGGLQSSEGPLSTPAHRRPFPKHFCLWQQISFTQHAWWRGYRALGPNGLDANLSSTTNQL